MKVTKQITTHDGLHIVMENGTHRVSLRQTPKNVYYVRKMKLDGQEFVVWDFTHRANAFTKFIEVVANLDKKENA